MSDVEILNRAVLGQNIAQQQTQLRNVPGAVFQLEKQPAFGNLGRDFKDGIKGPAGDNHAQVPIQHDKRLPHRIHDGMRKRAGVRRAGK